LYTKQFGLDLGQEEQEQEQEQEEEQQECWRVRCARKAFLQ